MPDATEEFTATHAGETNRAFTLAAIGPRTTGDGESVAEFHAVRFAWTPQSLRRDAGQTLAEQLRHRGSERRRQLAHHGRREMLPVGVRDDPVDDRNA